LNFLKNLSIYEFAALVFLIPCFFMRIFLWEENGNAQFYDLKHNYPLPFRNFEPFVIPILLIFSKRIRKERIIGLIFIAIFLVFIEFYHLFAYHLHPLVGTTTIFLTKFVKLYGYIIAISIYSLFFFDEKIFNKYFIFFIKFSIIASFILYFLYSVTGIPLQIHTDRGARIQGFLSEPSGFAPFLGAFLIIMGREKNYIYIFLAFIAIALTKSPTVFLTVIFSLLVYWLTISKSGGLISFLIGLPIFFGSYLIYDFVSKTDLNDRAYEMFTSDIGVVVAMGRLLNGVEDLKSGGEMGTNSRLQGVLQTTYFLEKNNLFWTGYGLNCSSALAKSTKEEAGDYTFLLTIVVWYGYTGLIVYLLLTFNAFAKLKQKYTTFYPVFATFFVTTCLNCAGGFVINKIVIMGFILAFTTNIHYGDPIDKIESANPPILL
jgi:hypothetical protein